MGSLTTDFESLYLKTGAQGFNAAGSVSHAGSEPGRSKSRLPGPEPLTAFPKKPTPFIVGKPTEHVAPTGSDLSFKTRMAHHYSTEKKPSNYERQQIAAAAIQRTISRFLRERRDRELQEKEDHDRARQKAERLKHSQERFRQMVRSGTQPVCPETGRLRNTLITDVEPRGSEFVARVLQPSLTTYEADNVDMDEDNLLSFASNLNADEFERDLEVSICFGICIPSFHSMSVFLISISSANILSLFFPMQSRVVSSHIPTRNIRPFVTPKNEDHRAGAPTHDDKENQVLFFDNNNQVHGDHDVQAFSNENHDSPYPSDAITNAYRPREGSYEDDEEAAYARKWEELRNRVGAPQARQGGVNAHSRGGTGKDTHCPKCAKPYRDARSKEVPAGMASTSHGSGEFAAKIAGPVQDNLPSFGEDGNVNSSTNNRNEDNSARQRENDTDEFSTEQTVEYCNCPPIWLSQPTVPRGGSSAQSRGQNRAMRYASTSDFDASIGVTSGAVQGDNDVHYTDKDIATHALEESEALQRVHSQQSMTYVVRRTLEQGGQQVDGANMSGSLTNRTRIQSLSQTAMMPQEQVYAGPRIFVCEGRAEAWQKVTQSVAKLPYQRPHPSV